MAKWQFGKPINVMNYGELAEELIHIIDLADNCDVDVEAIRQVLDIIEEKYPLNVEVKSKCSVNVAMRSHVWPYV